MIDEFPFVTWTVHAQPVVPVLYAFPAPQPPLFAHKTHVQKCGKVGKLHNGLHRVISTQRHVQKMAHTLDQLAQNTLFHKPTDLQFPVGGRYKIAPGLTGWANDYYDIRAPGIRDQIPNPSFPYFGPTPSSTWLRTNGNNHNVPAPPNFDGPMGGCPSWLQSQWAQRLGSLWFEILQNTPVDEHYIFRDLSQFSVPSPGVSALADFSMTSTRPFL
jgi:hypothetical protein